MAAPHHTLRFWGARGTVPTPAAGQLRYGGNTSCLAATLGGHEHLILDCGSGLRLFGAGLPAAAAPSFHVFLTHYHFDHVEGLPLFPPLFDPRCTIRIHGPSVGGSEVKRILQDLIRPPYFPVALSEVPAKVEYGGAGPPLAIADVTVDALPLNHPGGCLAYRLRHGGRSIVYATDHEHGEKTTDGALAGFARGASHLIYDATYSPAEYEAAHRGWGHSTWRAAVRIASDAGVENLVLSHHHPDRTDDDLDGVLDAARREFPATTLAHEGLELSF